MRIKSVCFGGAQDLVRFGLHLPARSLANTSFAKFQLFGRGCRSACLVQKKRVKGIENIFLFVKKYSKFGKVLRRPCDIFLKQCPIKSGAWVFFTARCDVLMARNVRHGVLLPQRLAESRQAVVLRYFKSLTF